MRHEQSELDRRHSLVDHNLFGTAWVWIDDEAGKPGRCSDWLGDCSVGIILHGSSLDGTRSWAEATLASEESHYRLRQAFHGEFVSFYVNRQAILAKRF